MDVKNDFPFLVKNQNLVYLDSACTTIKPKIVIDAECEYYQEYGACGGRSSHAFGRKTTERIDAARQTIGSFVGAKPEEVIFTKNTTEGINVIVNGFDFSKRKKVVTTVLEHHSVLLPLMRLRDKGTITLEILHPKDGLVPLESWQKAIDKQTALVVTHYATNTTGAFQDVATIAKYAHDAGARICVDGAQGAPHAKTDVKKQNIDFLAFSGHKMLAPTGIGALIVKEELLKTINPLVVGGGTVKTVTLEKVEYLQNHEHFEAGIQHYSGIFGFAKAVEYLKRIGMDKLEAHERNLREKLLDAVASVNATTYTTKAPSCALVAFTLKGAKPHELALMLDKQNIAVRSGFFCAQPAMNALGAKDGAVRASAHVYNTEEDIKKFKEALGKVAQLY